MFLEEIARKILKLEELIKKEENLLNNTFSNSSMEFEDAERILGNFNSSIECLEKEKNKLKNIFWTLVHEE